MNHSSMLLDPRGLPPVFPASSHNAAVRAIGRLSDADRDALRAHLFRLGAHDRRLRFGAEFDEAWLRQYAKGIDFAHDVVLAERDAGGRIVGIAEMRASRDAPDVREIAFSVDVAERCRGCGTRLVAAALDHARREGFTLLQALCSTGNAAMLRILGRVGFSFERRGVEVAVTLVLTDPPETPVHRDAAQPASSAKEALRLETFTADDGEVIRVARMGAGRPVVLLHGFACSHADWRPVATALARDHHVLAWHARAHWRSAARVDAQPTVERLADDLAQLLEHYELERPVLVGHSMGALVALQYLRSYGTENVGGLCVVDQSPRIVTTRGWPLGLYGRFARRQSLRFVAQLRADFAESVLRMLALGLNADAREKYLLDTRHIVRARRALRERDGAALAHLFASLASADFRSLVPTIDCPVLVVLGAQSNLFPARKLAEYWQSALRLARVETYAASDHFPHRSHAERFVGDLRALINSASDAREREEHQLRIRNGPSGTVSPDGLSAASRADFPTAEARMP